MNNWLHQEIAELRTRNEELEAKVIYLEERSQVACGRLMKHFKIQPAQSRILECLVKNNGNVVSAEQIFEFIESNAADHRLVVKVQIAKLRRLIAPYEIHNLTSCGYFLPDASHLPLFTIMVGDA